MGNKASHQSSASDSALNVLLSRPTSLDQEMFKLHLTAHHGVPSNANALAFCGSLGILAVGTASGTVKFYGTDGLEVLTEGPESVSHLAVGVTHLQFTAHQHLVVAYSDSSIRVFDLASGTILSCVSDAWTTSIITSIETLKYTDSPFFFVATDDGEIHVVHEATGRVSTYVIRPQDLSISHCEGVTAIATHPKDANLLLIAYDTYPAVLLWDFTKRRVIREFTLSIKTQKEACRESQNDASVCNSPQCLSWHSSGKRFVAGYKYGGIAVFRVDKTQGLYREMLGCAATCGKSLGQIKWLCAPPTSKHAASSGAIVFSQTSDSSGLTLIYPPTDGRNSEDLAADLYKADKLTWRVATIESINQASIRAFEAAIDHMDSSTHVAPLSLIVLSGNPLDGCLPTVSVQCLPCFIKPGECKEEWEWRINRLPEAAIIPPLLQLSPLTTFAVVNLSHANDTLQSDLQSTFDQAKYSAMYRVTSSGEFEWPLSGGSVLDPLPNRFVTAESTGIEPNSVLLLTGHANGCVLFWETRVAQDQSSKGTLRLLHVADASLHRSCSPESTEITCISFCPASRTLVLGFTSGEITIMDFKARESSQPDFSSGALKEQNASTSMGETMSQMQRKDAMGFIPCFSLHIHTEPVTKLVLSSFYGYVAVADAVGTTSLIDTKTQQFQVLVSNSLRHNDESVTVDSLLMSELVQTTEIPGSEFSTILGPDSNASNGKGLFGMASHCENMNSPIMMHHHEVIPVLFVGRGSNKIEMFHVQSATKMGETLVNSEKATNLASILLIDEHGKRIELPGRDWNEAEGSKPPVSLDKVMPEVSESSEIVTHTHSPDADFELTHQLLTEARSEQLKTKGLSWSPCDHVYVTAPPGSLGLHLCMEVKQHAVVQEYAEDSHTSALLRENGVRIGHTLIEINGVDVSLFDRDAVCRVLEKLQEREKRLVFAHGFGEISKSVDTNTFNSQAEDSTCAAAIEGPRFLVCACGRMLHIFQAIVPQAAEMARGPKDCPIQPLTSMELQGPVVAMSVVRVPVGETIENCLTVVDQSNRVYILSLPSLHLIYDTECTNLVSRLVGISFGGEVIVANTFGEIERYSLFAEATAMESAVLERNPVKTRLHRPECQNILKQAITATISNSKKRGMGADASKMFKKLVLSVTQDAKDLNQIFHFSTEAEERKQLLGDRSAIVNDDTAKTELGLSGTKDSLMQAQQRLVERGEKLNDLGLKTEQMKKTSEEFYQTMKAFNEKNANKKWYEF
ncbi:putative WD40/YVTN repeat-like-containing domain superfamily [Plasmopara halstedii]